MTEDVEQRQLIQWAKTIPEGQFLYHIPNENIAGQKWGIRNKQLGVRSGVPDLCLPIPAGGYHGLYIEMKTKAGTTSEKQDRWLAALNGFGYLAVVCHGWEEGRDAITRYLQPLHGGAMGDDEGHLGTKDPGPVD